MSIPIFITVVVDIPSKPVAKINVYAINGVVAISKNQTVLIMNGSQDLAVAQPALEILEKIENVTKQKVDFTDMSGE